MSAICYPQMKRFKYKDSLSTGCIAAGGGIDLMIPPSIGFVIYGVITEESIGKLLIAGIIPGIIQVGSFLLTIFVVVKLTPKLAPLRPTSSISWKEKLESIKHLWMVIFLFLLVMGGIYLGIFTPIEGGAVGAAGAILSTIITGRLTWQSFVDSFLETSAITVMILTLILGAMVFNIFLTLSNLPQALSKILSSLGSPAAVLAFILLLYLPLGCIMDATGMLVLTLPLYQPFLVSNNINLIWFGVLVIMMVEISLITPPVGMNVYVVQGVVKEVPMQTVFRGMVPFLIADCVVLFLLIFFPSLAFICQI